MLASLRRIPDVLEHELILLHGEKWRSANRRAHVANNPNPVNKVGAQLLRHVVAGASSFLERQLLSPYEDSGFEVIGVGASTTVLRRGSEVLKVVRDNSQLTGDDLRRLIEPNLREHEAIAVPTSVIHNFLHPRTGNIHVALVQPVIEGEALEVVERMDETLTANLKEFAERSLDVMVPRGLAPDVIGSGNLLRVSSDGSLKPVDTVALTAMHTMFSDNTKILRGLTRARPNVNIRDIEY